MTFFGREIHGPLKLIVIFVAIFFVSAGMCGIQLEIAGHSSPGTYGGNLAGVLLPFGLIELAAMAISLIGIVIVLILMAIGALTRQPKMTSSMEQTPSPDSLPNENASDQKSDL